MQDLVETQIQQWAKGQGVAVAHHLSAGARFDVCPRQRVLWQMNARESVEAAMLQCLQGNQAVADDGDILPFFAGMSTPLATKAPAGKGAQPHKVGVVTVVALDGTADTHAGNHDFFTLCGGTGCATCRQLVRIWCNTFLVCHACFFAGPQPCTKVAVNVLMMSMRIVKTTVRMNLPHHVSQTRGVVATPRKPDEGHGVAKMQAKLVMATQSGKLWDWTRVALPHCLDVLGVRLPSGSNRRQAREIAMHPALPLLA